MIRTSAKPAVLALAHAIDDLPAHVEETIEIGADHGVPLGPCHLVERGVSNNTGVVDQNIDGAKLGFDCFHAGRARIEVADVPAVARDTRTTGKRFGGLGVSGIGRRYHVPCGLKRPGYCCSDTPGPARHQRHPRHGHSS
jgi:hypothetical protein